MPLKLHVRICLWIWIQKSFNSPSLAVHCRNLFNFYSVHFFNITEKTTKVNLACKLAVIQSNKSMEPKEQTMCCCPSAYRAHCVITVAQ